MQPILELRHEAVKVLNVQRFRNKIDGNALKIVFFKGFYDAFNVGFAKLCVI